MRTTNHLNCNTPSMSLTTLSLPLRGTLLSANVLTSTNNHLFSINHGSESTIPVFCVYKNPSENASPQLHKSEKLAGLSPLMLLYKEIDTQNTQSKENIVYSWSIEFFLEEVDECDDTIDGQIREHINSWRQDSALFFLLGSFLKTQITSSDDLKELIRALQLSLTIKYKITEEDYGLIYAFFILHLKNTLPALCQEKEEMIAIVLSGFPNPAIMKPALDGLVIETTCFTLNNFTHDELNHFKRALLDRPLSNNQKLETFDLLAKVHLLEPESDFYKPTRFTIREMKLLTQLLTHLKQTDFSEKLAHLVSRQFHERFIINANQLAYLINHIYFSDRSCALFYFDSSDIEEIKKLLLSRKKDASDPYIPLAIKIQPLDIEKDDYKKLEFTATEIALLSDFLNEKDQGGLAEELLLDSQLGMLLSTFFFNEKNLETFIKDSNPETVLDDLISILQSCAIEKMSKEKIWESLRRKILPKLINNIDVFIRIRALPFLEDQDKLIAFISSIRDRLHEWIRNEDELIRFIRCLHLSGKESDNALREFIWDALKEQILKHVNSAEELDAFLTCAELNEAEKKEWHQLAVGAKWVSNAEQLNAACASNVLDTNEKKSMIQNTFERFTGAIHQQTPPPTSTPTATTPVSQTPQGTQETEKEIHSADPQSLSSLFQTVDQFVQLFNRFDKTVQERRLYLDALKSASDTIISNSDEFVHLFDQCKLTQPEREEIWGYLKSALIEKLKKREDTTYALFSCQNLTEKQYQETITAIAPHLKNIIGDLNNFLNFYQSTRFSKDYRIELLNLFKTELESWIDNIDSFFTGVLEYGLSTDQFDLFWNHHLQHVICKLVEENSLDTLIEVYNCSILTEEQRDHLCGSEKIARAYIKNMSALTELIDSTRMTKPHQNTLFSTIGFSNLKKIIYPDQTNQNQDRDTLCLDKLFQCNYLDCANPIIKRIILSEPILFQKCCDNFNEKMDKYIKISEIEPEELDMIQIELKLLRSEYRMRIVKISNEQSCSFSFFSCTNNLESLEIKIAGAEQILDEINKSPARKTPFNQSLIDDKKRKGRLGELAQLWEKTKALLTDEKAREDEKSWFSPR